MTNLNKNFLALAIMVGALIIGGAYVYTNQQTMQELSSQEAAEKAIAFINQTIEENVTASLLDVVDEGVVYRIHLKIAETEYDSYITKDGKLLFPNAFNLEEASQEELETEPASLEDFAKCLTDSGAKLYGAYWCGVCDSQKELFGEAAQHLPYIECSDQGIREMTNPECQEAKITGFPTWEFNGEKSSGFKTFEQLAKLSGCPIGR